MRTDSVQQLLRLQENPEPGRLKGFDIKLNNRTKSKKNTVICGKSRCLAPPERLELTTLRLGVAPIRHRQVTPDAKKCLEIQAFSVFPIPSDTML